jgi:UDP-glucose 4-epimerase
MDYVIAVPHNIIGPRQKYDDPYRNVVSIMINLMLQGRQPIIYGDGEQKRCFSYVDDNIYCLEKMAFADNIIEEVINIGPDEEIVTINKLAETIASLLSFDLDPVYMPGTPQEIRNAICCADKARNLLGYETKVSLGVGLAKMIDYIDERGACPFRCHLELEIENELAPRTWTERFF